MEFKILEPEVRLSFMGALLSNLKIEVVRQFILVPLPEQADHLTQVFQYGQTPVESQLVTIGEYSDYTNVSPTDAVEKAKVLGAGCATLYTALLKNAQHIHKHSVAHDLLENKNLKFTFVINGAPSVADPQALIPGWISFRFKFASWNAASSLKKSTTLEMLEGYGH
jgi:hypothetical protein